MDKETRDELDKFLPKWAFISFSKAAVTVVVLLVASIIGLYAYVSTSHTNINEKVSKKQAEIAKSVIQIEASVRSVDDKLESLQGEVDAIRTSQRAIVKAINGKGHTHERSQQ